MVDAQAPKSGAREIGPTRVMYGIKEAIAAASDRPHTWAVGRTPVFIICSPRQRVGKTLIARLLTEFFLCDGRRVVAFDANPNDESLLRYLPNATVTAAIGDTKSQMALFDRLIINDATPKVIDLAAAQFDPFFALMRVIGFIEDAPKELVSPVVLFVADRHRHCAEAYHMIVRRVPGSVVVPVHNEAIMSTWDRHSFPTRRANGSPLRIPRLPWTWSGVVSRNDFSFIKFLDQPVDFPTELHDWINRSFVAIRELQLGILVEDFRSLFNRRRAKPDADIDFRSLN
jgi:hypothetical protein